MRAWRPSLPCIVDWPGIGSGQRCVRPASPSSRGGLILLDDAGGDPAAVAQIDRVRGATAPEPEPLIGRSAAEIVVEDDGYRRRRHGLNAGNGLPRTVPLTCPAVINRDARGHQAGRRTHRVIGGDLNRGAIGAIFAGLEAISATRQDRQSGIPEGVGARQCYRLAVPQDSGWLASSGPGPAGNLGYITSQPAVRARARSVSGMFTHSGMFTTSGSVHDLVTVVILIGALLSGYAGMTIWARKGGKPGKGFLIGSLLGVLGVFILAVATPKQAETDSAARSAGLVRCPHCAELISHQARVCRYCQREVATPAPAGAL